MADEDSDHDMAATQELNATYHQQGWCVLSGVIPASEIPALRASVDALLRSPTNTAWFGPWMHDYEDGQKFVLHTKHGVHQAEPWVDVVARLQPLMADVLGVTAVAVVESTAIVKPPKHGQAFPPHQDSAYYKSGSAVRLVSLIHLDDTVPENGPVRYLSGSHTGGMIPHSFGGKKHLDVPMESMTEVCAKAGDVVCSDQHTVHASTPNRTDHPRRLVRVVWKPA